MLCTMLLISCSRFRKNLDGENKKSSYWSRSRIIGLGFNSGTSFENRFQIVGTGTQSRSRVKMVGTGTQSK